MNKLSAKQIVMFSLQSSSSLSKILQFAKNNCSENEYLLIHRSVAEISGRIFQSLVKPQLEMFPELEAEIDQAVCTSTVIT